MIMPHHFTFRPGTSDESIYRCVVDNNEYGLPESFRADDVLMDIGAHIGSFSHAALSRGAGVVHAFEAEPANFAMASRNLAPYGDRIRLHQKAVWRSDRKVESLSYDYSSDRENTGGGNVWSAGTLRIPTVPFDEVVREITAGGRRVRLLKIDCEGSEFPILLTSRMLHKISEIAGEFHEFGGEYDSNRPTEVARIDGIERFTMEVLQAKLQKAGFHVTWMRHPNSNLGLFRATRLVRVDGPQAGPARMASFLRRQGGRVKRWLSA
jgi:FkbM family methyltransferase